VPISVRPCADLAEYRAAASSIGQYFGVEWSDEQVERFLRNLPLDRMHAAWDDGEIVGGTGAFAFDLSVPGGSLPCAGISVVGVYPTHRRRGVLTALMRAELDAAHERGEPVSALWPSEAPIYGRFGYGLAAWCGEIELPRERAAFARPLERRGRVRIVESDEAAELFPPVWERVFAQRPGMFSREPAWWETRVLFDPPERRHGGGPKRLVVVELDGAVDAYAVYRHHMSFEAGSSTSRLGVIEALGATPRATAELWRYLLDVDWVETVTFELLPPDHPLFLLLAHPRRAKFRMADGLWVRLVDVGAALSGRTYAADHRVVLEVADEFCPWNAGRWRLESGQAARCDDEADLHVDAGALGSVFLGGVTFAQLLAAGRVEETREGAARRADEVFHTGVHPWCPEIF
jgi:predicted acetyltransferase